MRFHLAYYAHLCAAVRRILVRTLLGWLRKRGERAGISAGRSGAVVMAQLFEPFVVANKAAARLEHG